MMPTYDAIVLGVGGMGSAACFELARRGQRVLGLEQFALVHSQGSSHGQTRIIRTAYYEHPDYVPLVQRAFERWRDLECRTGRHLLTNCPCLNIGPADAELVTGVRASVREHALAAEVLSASEMSHRYPFRFPEHFAGVLEQQAGILHVEECVRAHIDSSVSLGAEIHAEEAVRGWTANEQGVEVFTEQGRYRAAKLVITAGAWATHLLADLGVPLTVMRQVLLWHECGKELGLDRFPLFIASVPGGDFYGMPAIDHLGFKVARHYGSPELSGPESVDWEAAATDDVPVRAFLDQYLPGVVGNVRKRQVCMYTLTPDRHFVLDVHPRWPRVTVAFGFSGHGFKFASLFGEVLADLVETGQTMHPIAMLRISRFQSGAHSALHSR